MEHEEGEVCSDRQKLMRMTHYDFINYKLTVFECCQVQTGPHAQETGDGGKEGDCIVAQKRLQLVCSLKCSVPWSQETQ